ncbi:MAG: hypothetical protein M3367_06590 [Acidobacteriota bacterium]|nr:hypothetical protein [Acidobacteriota bacterium]
MNERDFKLPEFWAEGADNRAHPSSRRDLFESSKLSQLPKLPSRANFELSDYPFAKASFVGCVVCGGQLEIDNGFQQAIKVCRKCFIIYAKVDLAFDEKEKRERREALERFVGGVK